MAKDDTRILGDINPRPDTIEPVRRQGAHESDEDQDISSMEGGSKHDRSKHSGSRDVTEGVTGGTEAETGGTRNYRQGSGATGGDIGHRPE